MKTLLSFLKIFLVLLVIAGGGTAWAGNYQVGAYYFPGWSSTSEFWNDLKGLPGSRSPGRPWPDREPLLGFNYPEESVQVVEQQIDWAADYGITFFAFDWYWYKKHGGVRYSHAIDAYMKAKNKNRLQFCLLWDNNQSFLDMEQFESVVNYWVRNYFHDPQYLKINGKNVVIIFTPPNFRADAAKFGKSPKELLDKAREITAKSGVGGVYFIGCSPALPDWINTLLPEQGYDAVTAYNMPWKSFRGTFKQQGFPLAENYQELTDGYESQWDWILRNSALPYIVPVTSGWDKRAWGSNTPHDNCASTPESFKEMLVAAKARIDGYPDKTMNAVIVYAWNEFGEGGYIEPTKKWGFQYLQAIKDVFGK